MSPFETCKILYGLITSGLVELKEDLAKLHTDRLQRMTPPDLAGLADSIHQQARQLLVAPRQGARARHRLPAVARRVRGRPRRRRHPRPDPRRGEDDLRRAGPNQAKGFLTRVQQLLAA